MTLEEAIKVLKIERGYFCDFKGCQEQQALTMAIKALEKQPCETIKGIPKDYKYDTETKDFLVYRHMYTGHEIHIEKPVPRYRLEQTSILDKIRAEFISLYPKNYAGEPELGGSSCEFSLNKVLNIIDKYKAESEVQDADSD